MAGESRKMPVYGRETLAEGQEIAGPALVIDPVATICVEPGWSARLANGGMLVLTRTRPQVAEAVGTRADPVRLEIFGGLFMGLAQEMGAALQHSASSVNIRERLDFSCAVFDGIEPGAIPPMSAWCPRAATKKLGAGALGAKTGAMTVMSGRCVPPA